MVRWIYRIYIGLGVYSRLDLTALQGVLHVLQRCMLNLVAEVRLVPSCIGHRTQHNFMT